MDDPIVKQKAHSFDFCSLLESYKVVCFLCTLKQETSETSHVHSKHEQAGEEVETSLVSVSSPAYFQS